MPGSVAALVAAVVVLLLSSGAAAFADPPLRANDRITDTAGALDAAGEQQVAAAIEALRTEKRVDLFVVFVGSFDGQSAQAWTQRSAQLSQLGGDDVLMAVATRDRAYYIAVGPGSTQVTSSSLNSVASGDVEPKLGSSDWAGAAVALADGLRGGSGPGVGAFVVVGGIAVVGGGAYVLSRRRRRNAGDPAPPASPEAPKDEFSDVSTQDLSYQASQALLDVDNAVQRSEQDLSAARGHFGDEAVAPFAAALEQSKADMLRAFEIRQQLDDEIAETEPQQRAMNADIVRACTAADARLDEQVAAFDRLRNLEATAPQYVAGLGERLAAVSARVPVTESAWTALQGRYATTAVAPVAGHVDQAKQLLAGADAELRQARAELANPGPAVAVVSGRAAEDALTHAETLLDGIGRREAELADAAGRYAGALAEVEQDLAEARAMVDADRTGRVGPLVARAEAAIAAADQAVGAAQPDPIEALRLLDEATTALDAGIADARAEQDRTRRAAAALEQALLTARSSVAAANDFVTTRRGAVGSPARTRLAEAQRHLQVAQQGGDPAAALAEAQLADKMAQEAQRLAESDVSRWSGPGSGGGGLGVDLGSLVLGGILSGGIGGGHRGGGGFGGSGGFGGGGFGTGGRF